MELDRRLLVVSYHAPPERAVGGLRWWGLSRHLARRGWRVRIVTRPRGAVERGSEDGIAVESVDRQTTVLDRYKAWRRSRTRPSRRMRGGSPRGPGVGGAQKDPADGRTEKGRGFIRANLADLIGFPDDGRGWILRAARSTRAAVREFRPSVVVSTGPPHSVHLAAAMAVGTREVPWIVDLRDPWSELFFDRSETSWGSVVTRRLEESVFRRADLVLTTTPEVRREVREHYPSARVQWLPNGVDAEMLPGRSAPSGTGLLVTHLGTLYLRRDPVPLVRAFAAFLARNPAAASGGAMLRLVGDVAPEFAERLDRVSTELKVREHIEVTGSVPRDRALEILAGSQLAVVLAQGQPRSVPAKLYEPIAMGIPTLVVTEADSATAGEGRRIGATVHPPADLEGMVHTLERSWNGRRTGRTDFPGRVDHASLVESLEELLFLAKRNSRIRIGR